MINPWNFWVPLFALIAFVIVLPPWVHFVSTYTTDLPAVTTFFASMTLPALAGLFLVSWFDPA